MSRKSKSEVLLELCRQSSEVKFESVEVEVVCLVNINTISLIDNKESIEEVN